MSRGRILGLLCALLLGSTACSSESAGPPGPAPSASDPGESDRILQVITTVEVNRYLATRIGEETVEVNSAVPPDADPLLWTPDRGAITELQGADLLLLNGAGLERWLDRVTLSPSRTVVLADAYRDRWLTFEGTVSHQHGPEGDHAHTGTDPHVWMDPDLVAVHARQIVEELSRRRPAHAAAYRARGEETVADLTDLGTRFRAAFGGGPPPRLFANHPAFEYLARRSGWMITNFDLDPESGALEPEVRESLREAMAPGAVLLWESQPSPGVAAELTALGVTSSVIRPCEQPPATGDWLAVMRENAARLAGLPPAPE